MKHAFVAGLGSPHGDDQIGWKAVEQLAPRLPRGVSAVRMGDPSELLSLPAECDRLWIVDGCRSGLPQGTVLRLAWPDERIAQSRSASTHAVGVGESLQLLATLGRLPRSVVLWAIEVGRAQPHDEMSVKLADCLLAACAAILEDVERTMQTGADSKHIWRASEEALD